MRDVTTLPTKPSAVFHHPLGFALYDALAMDLHAMKYAEMCIAKEREECAKLAASTICDTHIPTGINIYGGRAAKAILARK